MSPSAPSTPTVPPDVLADLERRLTHVERVVGVPLASSQPRRPEPEPQPVAAPWPAPGRPAASASPPVGPASGGDRASADPLRLGEARSAAGAPAGAPPAGGERTTARAALDEALVGGRLLAWAGGAALLFALGTLFWLGVRDGWLSESLRCVIGAVASVGLLAAGLRNARNGSAREASWAMAGTGLAGLYATGAVATATFDLVPDVVGLAALAVLGGASALLALRWEAPPLAGVGLLGALGAPVIAPVDGLVLPVVVLAMAATGLLLRHRPWTWLAAAASALALPQVVWHVGVLLDELQGVDASLATVAAPGLAALAGLAAGLAMVAGWEIRAPRDRERWSMPLLLVVHAAVAAALGGSYALVDEPVAAVVTLAAASALLVGSAVLVRRRAGAPSPVELVLLSVAVLVLDLGFAIGASGVLQLAGWAVAAVGFAFLARHAARTTLPVLIGGLGLHAGLTLVETLGSAGDGDGGFLTACAVLAAVCAVSGRVIAPRSEDARILLDVTALGVVLWWTAVTLPAEQLALVLAAESGALLLLDRRVHDVVARGAALVFVGIAAAVALLHGEAAAVQASWSVVLDGELWNLVLPLLAVAGAASVGVTTLRGAITMTIRPVEGGDDTEEVDVAAGFRTALTATAGGLLLLAASILAGDLTASAGGGTDAVAVVRDVLWASTGLALLAAGLVRAEAPVRFVGLSLLAGIGGKIALLDLADVDTAGRVIAWAVLGALLLVGAGLYARVKPTVEGVEGARS